MKQYILLLLDIIEFLVYAGWWISVGYVFGLYSNRGKNK